MENQHRRYPVLRKGEETQQKEVGSVGDSPAQEEQPLDQSREIENSDQKITPYAEFDILELGNKSHDESCDKYQALSWHTLDPRGHYSKVKKQSHDYESWSYDIGGRSHDESATLSRTSHPQRTKRAIPLQI